MKIPKQNLFYIYKPSNTQNTKHGIDKWNKKDMEK